MKVAFGDPPMQYLRFTQALSSPNIGILYLISYLRKMNNQVQTYYIQPYLNLKQHIEKLKQISPDLYGISFANSLQNRAYNTIKHVRKNFPTIPIICGGACPSADPEGVLNNSDADICIIGEGEVTSHELVDFYMNNKSDLHKIPGIAFRDNDQIIKTPPRPLIKDLDTIPMPAWDIINFSNYSGITLKKKSPDTCIVSSRGCPFNCTFCSNPVWKANKPWLRARSPKNIAEEIQYLYGRGIREIYIRADEFNINPKWCIEVCEEIQKLDLKGMYFQCNLRADNFPEELAKAMHDANFWMVHLGIESGNQRCLDGINKRITIKSILDTCQKLKKYKIKTFGFFMMFNIWEENNNLQFESPKEVKHTFAFARYLLRHKLISNISWGFATPMPGAKLYQIAKKYKIIKPNLKETSPWEITVNLPNVSEKTMLSIRRKGMILQGLYGILSGNLNWRNWRHILSKVKYILKSF
ncbi:MAG: radical SAM protein [Candidatus Helarchaeota archaeon]|nr:radical SAM protein [Candidatus Helarchaeota archaeon]